MDEYRHPVISSLLLPSLISLPVLICIIDIFHATAKGSLFLTWFIYLINIVSAIVTAFLMATMKLDMFIVLCCASAHDFLSIFCGAGNISADALPYFMKPLTWVFSNKHNNEAMIDVMVHGNGLDPFSPVRFSVKRTASCDRGS
uniref:Uncharacterized protein n=1 Tax=Tetranychus urticae TaxID=32264 RepID=T1KSJ9_TETUR